ncbi:MAG: undecaprenyl/decaprenyl-phosphate alpha-N-acetylglucosaminyl 1-phosphate transferase, partial [Phycisphaerae bacterium]|nr:undecaprenyl/decaprenyl-phosphate alpha-N-acetylglucosaminyl 1-phosphate transferase [Phycisphaerae bacterium]
MKTYLTVYFGAAVAAMLLVPILSRLAKRYRLVDAPGPRKVHHIPIPRIGGIVFVVSTLALVLPVFFLDNAVGQSFREVRTEFIVLLVAAGFVFAVGLIDDLRSVRGYIKLLCLIAASLAVCASGTRLSSISVGTWFELETGWAAWPLTVFWIIMITVCMNVIDGLDGLAAGVAAIVCGTILILALWSGQVAMAVLMVALLGSVMGFLFFNFHPAKIFMGDGGSMFLGFLIGGGSLVCQMKTHTLVGLALPFLVLGVPIFDTGFAVLRRRLLERRSMFAADRNHLHHRLMDIGLRQRSVAIVIYAVTAISASIGVFMLNAEGGWSVGLLVGGLLMLFSMFVCLHGGRYRKIRKALKQNWAIAREARAERHTFENTQVRMSESESLRAWWDTVCAMAKKMHFQSIELWNRRNGHYASTCVWNAPDGKFTTGKTLKLTLPFPGNGALDPKQARFFRLRCGGVGVFFWQNFRVRAGWLVESVGQVVFASSNPR